MGGNRVPKEAAFPVKKKKEDPPPKACLYGGRDFRGGAPSQEVPRVALTKSRRRGRKNRVPRGTSHVQKKEKVAEKRKKSNLKKDSATESPERGKLKGPTPFSHCSPPSRAKKEVTSSPEQGEGLQSSHIAKKKKPGHRPDIKNVHSHPSKKARPKEERGRALVQNRRLQISSAPKKSQRNRRSPRGRESPHKKEKGTVP